MAAITFTRNAFPDTRKFTLADTDAQQVTLLDGTKKVSVYFTSTAGTIAFEGTDGAAQDADAVPVPADQWHEFHVNTNVTDIFVAGSAAGVVSVMVEDR